MINILAIVHCKFEKKFKYILYNIKKFKQLNMQME